MCDVLVYFAYIWVSKGKQVYKYHYHSQKVWPCLVIYLCTLISCKKCRDDIWQGWPRYSTKLNSNIYKILDESVRNSLDRRPWAERNEFLIILNSLYFYVCICTCTVRMRKVIFLEPYVILFPFLLRIFTSVIRGRNWRLHSFFTSTWRICYLQLTLVMLNVYVVS